MKDSEFLKIARLYFDTIGGHPSFGLCALFYTVHRENELANKNLPPPRLHSLVTWAHHNLQGESLIGWLNIKGHITNSEYFLVRFGSHTPEGKVLKEKLMVTRKAWLDWMIAECERVESQES